MEEHAVYVRGIGSDLLIVGVYVDDLVVVGANQAEVIKFKGEMVRLFNMSDLGPLHYYLGKSVRARWGSLCARAPTQARSSRRLGSRGAIRATLQWSHA
jgi:hypothetical protein